MCVPDRCLRSSTQDDSLCVCFFQLLRTAISMRSDFVQAYINRGDILMKLNRLILLICFIKERKLKWWLAANVISQLLRYSTVEPVDPTCYAVMKVQTGYGFRPSWQSFWNSCLVSMTHVVLVRDETQHFYVCVLYTHQYQGYHTNGQTIFLDRM